jgi:sterol desaturase/sphingolipid hydroxylase (fatty acid hydroxylase superfamily)
MTWFRQLTTYTLFPFTFCSAIFCTLMAIEREISYAFILFIVSFTTAIIITIFERINPQYTSWNSPQKDILTDSIHTTVSIILLPPVLELALTTSLLAASLYLSQFTGIVPWPSQWPLFGQLLLAMLVSQFFEYWVHRLMHEQPLLWRLHATHHSPGRLYWLNSGRFHPIDTTLSFTAMLSSLLVLGAGEEVLLLSSVWVAVHGMFQHSNIRLRLGPLNYIFSMAELHRWHHSLILQEANANYGNNIIFWDLVFGTLYYPKEREASEQVGLNGIVNFPKNYLGQLATPFRWNSLTHEKAPSAETAQED